MLRVRKGGRRLRIFICIFYGAKGVQSGGGAPRGSKDVRRRLCSFICTLMVPGAKGVRRRCEECAKGVRGKCKRGRKGVRRG